MKVFLVDDHLVVLKGISAYISNLSHVEIVGTAQSAKDAISGIENTKPDLIITDYELPDMDGMMFISAIKQQFKSIKIIVLSMHDELSVVKGILDLCINGYVLKKDNLEELIRAVEKVKEDKLFVSDEINNLLLQSLDLGAEYLTNRELEIIRLISNEQTNRQIASQLSISERTVETHRKNIFRKTGTNNMVGLLKYAYANHLI